MFLSSNLPQCPVTASCLSLHNYKPTNQNCFMKQHCSDCTHTCTSIFRFRNTKALLLLSSYNPLWAFDFSTWSCQDVLFITKFVQFFTPNTLISFRTSSCHLLLVCPFDLFPIGLHLKILLAIPYSSILCKWPHHFNLWASKHLIMLAPSINLFNSWLENYNPITFNQASTVTRLCWRYWKIRHIIERAWSDTSAATWQF